MGLSNNDDAMNKIPLKSVTDDEEKNGGEFIHDTATAEEARREQRYVLQFGKIMTTKLKSTLGSKEKNDVKINSLLKSF